MRPCAEPGCPVLVAQGSRCPAQGCGAKFIRLTRCRRDDSIRVDYSTSEKTHG
jgi:hypothetical protein